MNGFAWEEWALPTLLTLGHFLWQGAALGLLALIGLLALRRASARLRYGLLCTVLAGMALCPPLTLVWLLRAQGPARLALAMPPPQEPPLRETAAAWPPPETPAPLLPAAASTEETAPLPSLDLTDQSDRSDQTDSPAIATATAAPPHASPASYTSYPQDPAPAPAAPPPLPAPAAQPWLQYAPWLLLAYALGVLFMWLRLILALHGGQRLRRRAYPLEDAALLEAFARQATLLGLRAAPAVAFCERVAVPTVVGVLRPLILLPVTIHTGLNQAQIELLLCHELAHIRRYDHLINLLQSVVEAFLFFHPVVLWVSRRIRIERELCCDDLVLAQGGESMTYADALLRMAESSAGTPRYALLLSAAGHCGQLTRRLHRILDVPAPRMRLTRTGLAGLLLSGALGIFAIVQVAAMQAKPEEVEEQEEPVALVDRTLERSLDQLFAAPDPHEEPPEEPQIESPPLPPAETSAPPPTESLPTYETTVTHAWKTDWYDKQVEMRVVDRNGKSTTVDSFKPVEKDDPEAQARVAGFGRKFQVRFVDTATFEVYEDGERVAQYPLSKDGARLVNEAPAAPTALQEIVSGAAAAPALEAALHTIDNEPDWGLRKLAVQRLAVIGGDTAVEELTAVLRGYGPHKEPLETALLEGEYKVRAAAAEALGALKAEEAVPYLAAALRQPPLH